MKKNIIPLHLATQKTPVESLFGIDEVDSEEENASKSDFLYRNPLA